MRFYTFFLTVFQIIIDCRMKGIGKFCDTLPLEIDKTIYSFNLAEKDIIRLTKGD